MMANDEFTAASSADATPSATDYELTLPKSSDEARTLFFETESLTYGELSPRRLKKLRDMLEEELTDNPNVDVPMSVQHGIQMSWNDNHLAAAYIRLTSPEWDAPREGVSFNPCRDDAPHDDRPFIGFAGWASTRNTLPVWSAFGRWCDWMVKDVRETAPVVAAKRAEKERHKAEAAKSRLMAEPKSTRSRERTKPERARAAFSDHGLAYEDLTPRRLRVLRAMIQGALDAHVNPSIEPESRLYVPSKIVRGAQADTDDTIHATLRIASRAWKHAHECVTFNPVTDTRTAADSITLCGWADADSVVRTCVEDAFCAWCDWARVDIDTDTSYDAKVTAERDAACTTDTLLWTIDVLITHATCHDEMALSHDRKKLADDIAAFAERAYQTGFEHGRKA